jgi:hypothetical protein
VLKNEHQAVSQGVRRGFSTPCQVGAARRATGWIGRPWAFWGMSQGLHREEGGGTTMEVEEFLNVINECDVLRDDIDDIRGRVALTKTEGGKLAQATDHVDKAKSILTDLFPTIRSLDEEVREDLSEELNEVD